MATFRPNKRDLETIKAILAARLDLGKNQSGAIRVALEEWRANHMEEEVSSVHDFDKSGLGIGGLGRHVEQTIPDNPEPVPDMHFAPTGTTEGKVTEESGTCDVCGTLTRNWNPGAGAYLCLRHWDSY